MALAPARVGAQASDTIPGVALGLLYEGGGRPVLAVAPFGGSGPNASVATQIEAIVTRDLELSDRFQVTSALPPGVRAFAGAPDYALWDRLGIDWVVTGRIETRAPGPTLVLEVHDAVYARLHARHEITLTTPSGPAFRMTVHHASDGVVEAVFEEPGMAATLIAFSMSQGGGPKDLWLVDSDGQNLRRVATADLAILSPSWHPSAAFIAYLDMRIEGHRVLELDLASGERTEVPALGTGTPMSPVYLPDGQWISVTIDRGSSSTTLAWDHVRRCCERVLLEGATQDLSPTFSADGTWMAFTSRRVGRPLVHAKRVDAPDVRVVAPYLLGQAADFTAPDWSPRGNLVAYHGNLGRGNYQILVSDGTGGPDGARQLTWEGNNEAPSWAPDGRHLVFAGERPEGSGLFVLDTVSGRVRLLVAGRGVTTPDWSPTLPPPAP